MCPLKIYIFVGKGKNYLDREQKARLVFLPLLTILKEFRNELIKTYCVIFPFTERMSFLCPTYKHMFSTKLSIELMGHIIQ